MVKDFIIDVQIDVQIPNKVQMMSKVSIIDVQFNDLNDLNVDN